MNLRDWQQKATDFYLKHNNCIFSVATGSGKTYLAINLIKELQKIKKDLKVLIVTPKNVISERTWLPELHEYGFPINKVGLINEFAKEINEITLISIQSLKIKITEEGGVVKEIDDLNNEKYITPSKFYNFFDLVIFDEVHNYASYSYKDIILIEKKYKMGLSATIKREDMRHIYIEKAFNYNTFNYDIEQALKDGILNPFDFKNIILPIDNNTLKEYTELTQSINNTIRINNGIKDNNYLKKLLNKRKQLIYNYPMKKEIVKEIIQNNPDSKILVFNQYNKIGTELYWELFDIGAKADIINSVISKERQANIFKDFENGDINVLLATTMLDEGYNLPKIDIAILMASNSTDKQFFQRMGRVLRKKEINSQVYYLTVAETFEVDNLNKKLKLIKKICNSYKEVQI